MKLGANNYRTNLARNTGLANTSPSIAKKELIKSSQVGDKAFLLNSHNMVHRKFLSKGRDCSCMQYSSPEQTLYAEDSEIDTPVILLQEDDGEPDDVSLDEALEMLENPKDTCPLCYGTSVVGNYKAHNCIEFFLDTTYRPRKMFEVDVEEGKPFYFEKLSDNSKIQFKLFIPSYFESYEFLYLPKDLKYRPLYDISIMNPYTSVFEKLTEDTMLLYAKAGSITVEIPVIEPTITFFMRFVCSDPTIKVNFPNISSEIESGEHDYFSSITASVDSKLRLSNRDLLYDKDTNLLWRITGVETKEPMNVDVGKEITIRKVRGFETYALIP